MTDELAHYLQLYQSVLEQILQDIGDLNDEEGKQPTGCAGWSVKDQISQVEAEVAQGDIEVLGPLGSSRKLSVNLPIRVLDLYGHRLDISRALGRPSPVDGAVADFVTGRCFAAWSALLAKRTELSGTLTLGILPPHFHQQDIVLGDSPETGSANGSLRASIIGKRDTMLKLAMGRSGLDEVLAEAETSGDTDLLDAVKPHLGFTP